MPIRYSDFIQDADGATDRQREVADFLVQAARRHAKSPEFAPAAALPRSTIDASLLSDEDLKGAGFVKSYMAVPETGQSRLATYRHPMNGLHFHRHPGKWMFHEDSWPSLQMVMRRYSMEHPGASTGDKLRFMFREAIPQSAGHMVNEGAPGWMQWGVGRVLGSDGITGDSKVHPGRALAGMALLTAALSVGQGVKDNDMNIGANAATVAGLVGGHLAAKSAYKWLQGKTDFFKHPSLPATGLLVGTPLLAAYAARRIAERRRKQRQQRQYHGDEI